ncbi:MAG: hypothetical protein R3E31_28995 [Chloroflexota bacterium]
MGDEQNAVTAIAEDCGTSPTCHNTYSTTAQPSTLNSKLTNGKRAAGTNQPSKRDGSGDVGGICPVSPAS